MFLSCKIRSEFVPSQTAREMSSGVPPDISEVHQVFSPGWPLFTCSTRLSSSGHCGGKPRKACAKAWGVMPCELCDRLCWAAETAVVCKATRWTATCRELGSNFCLCVAQRCTEFAVSRSTTNSTSVWLAEGFPTWIAQISGSWESDEFGGADDGICCRVNAGKPIVEVGVAAVVKGDDPLASGINVDMGGVGALSSLFWSCVTIRIEGRDITCPGFPSPRVASRGD